MAPSTDPLLLRGGQTPLLCRGVWQGELRVLGLHCPLCPPIPPPSDPQVVCPPDGKQEAWDEAPASFMEKGRSEREALLKILLPWEGEKGGGSIELEEALEERRLTLYCLFIYPK